MASHMPHWRPPAVHGPPDTGGLAWGGNKLLATAEVTDVHETPHLHCNCIWVKMRINDYRTYYLISLFSSLSGSILFYFLFMSPFAPLQVPCRVPSHLMETRCPRPSCSRVTPLFECFRHQGIWWISRDFKGSMAVLSQSWRLGSRLVSWLPLTPYGQPRLKSVMDSMAADGEAAPLESMASTWSKIQRYPKFAVCSHIFPQTKYDEMNIWKPLSSILASWVLNRT